MKLLRKVGYAIRRSVEQELKRINAPSIWYPAVGGIFVDDPEQLIHQLQVAKVVEAALVVEVYSLTCILHDVEHGVESRDRDLWRVRLTHTNGKVGAELLSHQAWNPRWLDSLAKQRDIFHRYVERSLGVRTNAPIFEGCAILLASELVGPYVDRVAALTGLERSAVERVSLRLRTAEIWGANTVHWQRWYEKPDGRWNFLFDYSVAVGRITRTWSDEVGDYYYKRVDKQ